MLMNNNEYIEIIETIKGEIRGAQYKAALSVNRELIMLYYHIGTVINEHKTWGSKFIEILPQIFVLLSRMSKAIPCEILNIWRNWRIPILTRNLCNRLLHKFRGGIPLFYWINS